MTIQTILEVTMKICSSLIIQSLI